MGIDIGSSASKCIIMKNGEEVIGKSVISVGTGTSGPDRVVKAALNDAGLEMKDMNFVIATGYGRNSITEATLEMSELSCHAYGTHFLFPDARTVIDIGGQDAKVLNISDDGSLINFVMNDKCAAGTGRFLDVMSRILEVDISELGLYSALSTKHVNISSTCTVFAESEVISQLSKAVHKNDIIKGIHKSVAGKVSGLARRIGLKANIVLTGGLAQNTGLVKELEDELGHKIQTSPLSQFAGALGAARLAYRHL
jgi:predicted CoA-substrate-specific enzyme activase